MSFDRLSILEEMPGMKARLAMIDYLGAPSSDQVSFDPYHLTRFSTHFSEVVGRLLDSREQGAAQDEGQVNCPEGSLPTNGDLFRGVAEDYLSLSWSREISADLTLLMAMYERDVRVYGNPHHRIGPAGVDIFRNFPIQEDESPKSLRRFLGYAFGRIFSACFLLGDKEPLQKLLGFLTRYQDKTFLAVLGENALASLRQWADPQQWCCFSMLLHEFPPLLDSLSDPEVQKSFIGGILKLGDKNLENLKAALEFLNAHASGPHAQLITQLRENLDRTALEQVAEKLPTHAPTLSFLQVDYFNPIARRLSAIQDFPALHKSITDKIQSAYSHLLSQTGHQRDWFAHMGFVTDLVLWDVEFPVGYQFSKLPDLVVNKRADGRYEDRFCALANLVVVLGTLDEKNGLAKWGISPPTLAATYNKIAGAFRIALMLGGDSEKKAATLAYEQLKKQLSENHPFLVIAGLSAAETTPQPKPERRKLVLVQPPPDGVQ